MAEPPEQRTATTYMSKEGFALPIKQTRHEASGLNDEAKHYIRRNQKISRLAKKWLPPRDPDDGVPLRSRAQHLSARRTDAFSTSHQPVRWYEQKSFSRSQKAVPRDIRRRALGSHPVALLGEHTPFHGVSNRPGPAPTSSMPLSPQLAAKIKGVGNWPLPDTPRCAELHLAELARVEAEEAFEVEERARRDQAALAKTQADVEFRALRRKATKAQGLPSPPQTPLRRSLADSDSETASETASSLGSPPPSRGSLGSISERPDAVAAHGANDEGAPARSPSKRTGATPNLEAEIARKKKKKRKKQPIGLGKPLEPPPIETVPLEPPRSQGLGALLNLGNDINSKTHRALLWHWRTVCACFRVEFVDQPWPVAPDTAVTGMFDGRSPPGSLRARKVAEVFRLLEFTDLDCIRLVEARLPDWLDGVCTRDADGDGDDDGFWTLRAKNQPEPVFDPDAPPMKADLNVPYTDFLKAMTPTPQELHKIKKYHADQEKERLETERKLEERKKRRKAKQRELRKGALQDLQEAWDDWPPRLKKGRPAYTTKERQPAMIYVVECGADFEVTQDKKKGLVAAAMYAASGVAHVQLRAPGLKQILWNCCLEGMGYGGYSASEIVETFRVYTAERVQAVWRAKHGDGPKWARVREMFVRRDRELTKSVFDAWWPVTRRQVFLRTFVYRKLIAWAWWARGVAKRKNLFRLTFWPLRTWRLEARRCYNAREKAKFLKMVWIKVVKKRHHKAWRRWVSKRVKDRAKADRFHREFYLLEREGSKAMTCWRAFALQRRRLRRAWFKGNKGGSALLKRVVKGRKGRALAVWKYYHFLAQHCKKRAASWFRRIRADDETRRVLARKAKNSAPANQPDMEAALNEFDAKRVHPPPIPRPADASCFRVAPSVDELKRRDAYQDLKKQRLKDHKKLVLIGRKRAKTFNASVRSRTHQEVRAEKRKRERDDDCATARLAVEAALDAFERMRCAASTLTEDQRRVCEPLLQGFVERVFPREVAAAYLRYWRRGPQALELLQSFAVQKREENRADLCYAFHCRRRAWATWKEEVQQILVEKKKLAKEEAVRLKRARKNAKGRGSRDLVRAEAQAVEDAALQAAQDKEPPKPKKRRGYAAGDVFRSRVTSGHRVIEEEQVVIEKAVEIKDPYAEDRKQQHVQLKKIQGYLTRAQTIVKEVRIQQAEEKEEDEREARRTAKEELEIKAFLEDKDEAFAESHQKALEWTDDFAIYAEKKYVETLQRVQREAQAHYDKQLMRQSLRLMRLPWAEKRAISLMNRQILRNRLRLCAGWRKVNRSMPRYFRLRVKYHCFLDWVRLVKNRKLIRSSALKPMLLRRKARASLTTRLLKERGARRCRSIHQDRFADVEATFARWSTYAFDQIRWRCMTLLGLKRLRLKRLQTIFSTLKSEAGFGHVSRRTPWVRRLDADLGVCSLYFVAPRRKTDLLNNLRKANAVHRKAVADGARNGPTFKKFVDAVSGNAQARLYAEQRLLLKAFELRGNTRHEDVHVVIQRPPDADAVAELFKDMVCPPGVRVCAVKVCAKRGHGVLGVGTELQGDGDRIDRPFRGGNANGKFAKETFVLSEDEHFTAIELHCSKAVVEAIRFEVSVLGNVRKDRKEGMGASELFERKRWCGIAKTKQRWSKLYGEVSSRNPQIYTIRGPPDAAIVSLRGLATASRIIGLGAVCRVINEEGVLSASWTRPLRAPATLLAPDLPSVTLNSAVQKANAKKRWSKMRNAKVLIGRGLVATGQQRQVDEFAAVVKMRKTEATEALKRCKDFARRVWTSNIFRADESLRPLLKMHIMTGLARWLFNAIAAPLVPAPNKNDRTNAMLAKAEKALNDVRKAQERAHELVRAVGQRRADHALMVSVAAATPRDKQTPQQRMVNAARAMGSSLWRAKEARRKSKDERDLAQAASDHALASSKYAPAQLNVDRWRDKMISLDPRAPRVRRKFRKLITIARRQHQLQGDHEGGAVKFLEDVNATCDLPPNAGGALPTRVFERVLDGLHVRKQKEARATLRAERRAAYERRLAAPTHVTNQYGMLIRNTEAEPGPWVDEETTAADMSDDSDGWG